MKILEYSKYIPYESRLTGSCFLYGLDLRKSTCLRVAALFAATILSLTNIVYYVIIPDTEYIIRYNVEIVKLIVFAIVLKILLHVTIAAFIVKLLYYPIKYIIIALYINASVIENLQRIKKSVFFVTIFTTFNLYIPSDISEILRIAKEERLSTQEVLFLAEIFAELPQYAAINLSIKFERLPRAYFFHLVRHLACVSRNEAGREIIEYLELPLDSFIARVMETHREPITYLDYDQLDTISLTQIRTRFRDISFKCPVTLERSSQPICIVDDTGTIIESSIYDYSFFCQWHQLHRKTPVARQLVDVKNIRKVIDDVE